jgi:hypothetical protein
MTDYSKGKKLFFYILKKCRVEDLFANAGNESEAKKAYIKYLLLRSDTF